MEFYTKFINLVPDEHESSSQADESSPNLSAGQASHAEKNEPTEVEPMDTEGNVICVSRGVGLSL